MKPSNPYYSSASIADPTLFFNRSASIEKLLNPLFAADATTSWSIVGQRKIGKTSLVKHIARPSTHQSLGYELQNRIFVYFDCQRHYTALRNKESFFCRLCDLLYHTAPEALRSEIWAEPLKDTVVASWEEEWERVFDEITGQSYYVILVLDEFAKAIMQRSLIEEGLFGQLRAYALDPWFKYITCTSQPLIEIFEDAFKEFGVSRLIKQSESDFFNVARPHDIMLFGEDDIREVITVPAHRQGVTFTEEDITAIIRIGGRFPFFIQLACSNFFDAYIHGDVRRDQLIQQSIDESTHYWESYWTKLTPPQQQTLVAIARGQPSTQKEIDALRRAALIYEQDGTYYPFSEEFGHYIRSKSAEQNPTVQMGQVLANHYEIRKIVDTTRHSVVVKAWDALISRHVAIKLLDPDGVGEEIEKRWKRLIREARILDELRHPNIGRLFIAIQEPHGLIMEWLEGQSLEELIEDSQTRFTPRAVCAIGAHLADALAAAHALGIVHRDIKPANIIQLPNGQPVLIDFDIARAPSLETITHGSDGISFYVGSPRYSAPEQFPDAESGGLRTAAEDVGPRTDVFSLGVVLYQMLTQQLPYSAGNKVFMYPNSTFPVLLQRGIPDALYRLLAQALNARPKDRLDAAEFRDELLRCMASLPSGEDL